MTSFLFLLSHHFTLVTEKGFFLERHVVNVSNLMTGWDPMLNYQITTNM